MARPFMHAARTGSPRWRSSSGRSCSMIWSCSVRVPVETTTFLPERMAGTR
ncbi:MAG: hypothetical protein M5U28_36435 [Sandaracinaceae bacterium]|nr:hypothetical protein [Sandaracinaceae bacterium]